MQEEVGADNLGVTVGARTDKLEATSESVSALWDLSPVSLINRTGDVQAPATTKTLSRLSGTDSREKRENRENAKRASALACAPSAGSERVPQLLLHTSAERQRIARTTHENEAELEALRAMVQQQPVRLREHALLRENLRRRSPSSGACTARLRARMLCVMYVISCWGYIIRGSVPDTWYVMLGWCVIVRYGMMCYVCDRKLCDACCERRRWCEPKRDTRILPGRAASPPTPRGLRNQMSRDRLARSISPQKASLVRSVSPTQTCPSLLLVSHKIDQVDGHSLNAALDMHAAEALRTSLSPRGANPSSDTSFRARTPPYSAAMRTMRTMQSAHTPRSLTRSPVNTVAEAALRHSKSPHGASPTAKQTPTSARAGAGNALEQTSRSVASQDVGSWIEMGADCELLHVDLKRGSDGGLGIVYRRTNADYGPYVLANMLAGSSSDTSGLLLLSDTLHAIDGRRSASCELVHAHLLAFSVLFEPLYAHMLANIVLSDVMCAHARARTAYIIPTRRKCEERYWARRDLSSRCSSPAQDPLTEQIKRAARGAARGWRCHCLQLWLTPRGARGMQRESLCVAIVGNPLATKDLRSNTLISVEPCHPPSWRRLSWACATAKEEGEKEEEEEKEEEACATAKGGCRRRHKHRRHTASM